MSDLLTASKNLLAVYPAKENPLEFKYLQQAVDAHEARDTDRRLLASLGNPTLTPTQLKVLKFIRDYITQTNVSPTLEEVAEEMRRSKVNAREHIQHLVKKGVLTIEKYRARSIRIVYRGKGARA